MINYPLIGQRLFNVPLVLRPDKAEIVCAALMEHLGITKLTRMDATTMGVVELNALANDGTEQEREQRRYYEVVDGVAIIPIQGSLAQRVGGLDPYSGMVGYNQIEVKLDRAIADPQVRSILLDIDSPGGEVAGCFDLSRKIASVSARNGGKPIIGAANEMACSGGYALISGADEVYTTDTGITGSIGVWTLLVDMRRALENDGIEVTLIRAGERKARGNRFEGADEQTMDKLLAWVTETRMIFAEMVAQNRRISVETVLNQEGDWFPVDEAMTHGLVDGKGPMTAIFERARTLAGD